VKAVLIWALLGLGCAVLVACGGAQKTTKKAQDAVDTAPPVSGPERHILALGDSLFAGYGVKREESYPARLEAALRAKGVNVRVHNAGVSGDTSADGLARLVFTLASQAQKPDLVIISLGGNDMLRALPPEETRANMAAILAELRRRNMRVVLMGMLAAPNLGKDYVTKFKAIYPDLAKQYGAGLVPFFLSAVVEKPELQQADHIHPTAQGIEAMVAVTMDDVLGAILNLE
jgi:acyl-CoA thioesterase I